MFITLSSGTRPLPCYRNIMEIGTEVNLKSPGFMTFALNDLLEFVVIPPLSSFVCKQKDWQ